ncbi:MAG: DUF4340 domain-containing protein [Planctomycetota bacterium]
MRLKPALVTLIAFVIVIAALAVFVATHDDAAGPGRGQLADQPLFPDLTQTEIARLELRCPRTGDTPVVFERDRETRLWEMTSPMHVAVLQDPVNDIAGDVAGLTVVRGYPAKSFVEYELDRPAWRLGVQTRAGREFTLAFGARLVELAGPGPEEEAEPAAGDEPEEARSRPGKRYARLDQREQVLIVEDKLCPKIDRPPTAFRVPFLVYADAPAGPEPIAPRHVRTVSIHVSAGEAKQAVALERAAPGRWRLTEPWAARADRRILGETLAAILGLRIEEGGFVDERPGDPTAYGLASPTVSLALAAEAADGAVRRYEIRVGDHPPDRPDLFYAQSSSRPTVVLVSAAAIRDNLMGPAEDFRDRHLVTFDVPDVVSVTLLPADGRRVTLVRRSRGSKEWSVRSPPDTDGRASRPAVVGLIASVADLMAQEFVTESAGPAERARFGLADPAVEARFKLKDGSERTVRLGKSPAGRPHLVYAAVADEPSVTLVPADVVRLVSRPVRSLRSKRLLEGFVPDEAEVIRIERDGDSVLLRRRADLRWRFVEPLGHDVEPGAPRAFLAGLESLEIEGWPADRPADYAPFGLAEPDAVLTIQTKPVVSDLVRVEDPPRREPRTFTLRLGKTAPNGRQVYARLASEPNVYLIDARLLKQLRRGYLLFRDRQVLDFDADAVEQVTIERPGRRYRLRKARKGLWLLVDPPIGAGNVRLVPDLVAALSALRAAELVQEGGWGERRFGLEPDDEKPFCKATLVIRETEQPGGQEPKRAEETRTLIVGRLAGTEDPEARYAVVAERGLVFVIPGRVARRLDREFAPRTAMDVPKARVRGVSVVHRDGSCIQVAREPLGRWRITSHEGIEPDRARIADLAEEARRVRADHFVAYTADRLDAYGLNEPRFTVFVTSGGGRLARLKVGSRARGADLPPGEWFYATASGLRAVFLLPASKVAALAKHIEDIIEEK